MFLCVHVFYGTQWFIVIHTIGSFGFCTRMASKISNVASSPWWLSGVVDFGGLMDDKFDACAHE